MLQVRATSNTASITFGGKVVVIKRDLASKELVEAHGIIASPEVWFFAIIPALQVQQRQRELGGAS